MWTGALSAVPDTHSPFRPDVRLTQDQTAAVVAAVADALVDAELTVEELDEAVVSRAGAWAGDLVIPAFQGFWPRWRQAIAQAAYAGALVFGADRGRKVTYTSPRRVVSGFAPEDPATAVPSFLRRYLDAFGPATPEHLARWLSAPVPWATEVFASAGPGVEPVEVAGQQRWVNAGDTEPAVLRPSVRLLPYFDALSVGFQPREDMFPGRAAERALARGQAGNFPVLVVDGVVTGVWHLRRAGRRVHITVETWGRLGASRMRGLERQAERIGEIVDGEAVLTQGQVSVGPHA